MPFCPTCKSEFRLGFAHCQECDVDLVDELPEAPEPPPPPPNPAFKMVYKTTEMADAYSIHALLEGHGIESSIENQLSGITAIGIPTSAAPFVIAVPSEDARKAEEILQQTRKKAASVPMKPEVRTLWFLLLLLFAGVPVVVTLLALLKKS